MALEVQPHAGGELLQRLGLAGDHVNLRRRSSSRPNCTDPPKVLLESLPSLLKDELGTERIGDAHVAGSDALLTLSCSSHIVHSSGHKLAAGLSLLSGPEQLEIDMAMLSSATSSAAMPGHSHQGSTSSAVQGEKIYGRLMIVLNP